MRNFGFLAVFFGIAQMAGATAKPFGVRDLVMMDRVSDPQASPAGDWIAFTVRETDLENNKGINGVWLVSPESGAAPRRLGDKGQHAEGAQWSADGRYVYFMSSRSGAMQVWRQAVAGKEAEQVTDYPLDVGSFRLSPDSTQLALSMEVFLDCETLTCTKDRLKKAEAGKAKGQLYDKLFMRHWDTWKNGTRSQLFVASLEGGHASAGPVWLSKGIDGDVPSKPFGDATEYAFAPDGKSIVFTARVAGKEEAWSTNLDLHRAATSGQGRIENLTEANKALDVGPLISKDGNTLYYRAMKRPGFEADRSAIMARDLRTRAVREIAPDWDRSPNGLILSKNGKTLYAFADDMGQASLFAIDVARGKVKKLAGDGAVSGVTEAGSRLVFAKDDLRMPAQLFAIAKSGGSATRLTRFNEERLAGLAMGDYEQFSFAGANNDRVYAWLIKPVQFDPEKKYPIALLIHGGPQGSFNNHFHYRWNPQTYAGQGYATLMIDFHGSTGYGQAFTDAITQDWGGKPLEDLKKGLAAALEKYPFLDADRACALGGSYGGFMVNWIASQWQGAFKCLVSHASIMDARSMSYTTEELWFDEWERGGTPFDDPENYDKDNPVQHVKQWKLPMLVIHGQNDYRVPVEQGIAVFTALQRRGIPSQFLYFPDENHWILKPHNSIQWHDTVNQWLARWLKP